MNSEKDFDLGQVSNLNIVFIGKLISCEANDIKSTVVSINSRSFITYISPTKNGNFSIVLPCVNVGDLIDFQGWDFLNNYKSSLIGDTIVLDTNNYKLISICDPNNNYFTIKEK